MKKSDASIVYLFKSFKEKKNSEKKYKFANRLKPCLFFFFYCRIKECTREKIRKKVMSVSKSDSGNQN